MKRSMMQVYVEKSDEAVPFYMKAFDAVLISSYKNDNGTFYHSELDIDGEILAVSERNSVNVFNDETITGTTMQFCLHYGDECENAVKKAYEVLKEGAKIVVPLAACDFSMLMTDLIDKFGVRWCIFC